MKLRLYINNLKFSLNTQCPSSHWWWINSAHQLFMQNWTVFLFNITQVCRLSTITLVYSSLSFRTIYYFRHCNFYWAHIISQIFHIPSVFFPKFRFFSVPSIEALELELSSMHQVSTSHTGYFHFTSSYSQMIWVASFLVSVPYFR